MHTRRAVKIRHKHIVHCKKSTVWWLTVTLFVKRFYLANIIYKVRQSTRKTF